MHQWVFKYTDCIGKNFVFFTNGREYVLQLLSMHSVYEKDKTKTWVFRIHFTMSRKFQITTNFYVPLQSNFPKKLSSVKIYQVHLFQYVTWRMVYSIF